MEGEVTATPEITEAVENTEEISSDVIEGGAGEPESIEDFFAQREAERNGEASASAKEEEPAEEEAPEEEAEEPAEEIQESEPEPEPEPVPEPPKSIKVDDMEYDAPKIQELEKFKSTAEANIQELARKYEGLTNQANQLVEMLKNDPAAILDRLDINREALDEWYYHKFVTENEAERQGYYDRRDLNRLRNQEKQTLEQRQKAEAQAKHEAEVQRNREIYLEKINSAIKEMDLPKTDWTVSQIAKHMQDEMQKGNRNIQPRDIAKKVKKEFMKLQKSSFDNLSAEELAEQLGPEALKKLRQRDIEKATKKKKAPTASKPIKQRKPASQQPSKKINSIYEALDGLDL